MSKTNRPREHKPAVHDKVARTSPEMAVELTRQLRAIVPEAFSEGILDLERLSSALGLPAAPITERYQFTWTGKQEALKTFQRVSSAALHPVWKESLEFDRTNNVFVEGDNLEVLKLLYKSYHQRVKCIYIDPPYNTGNDFVYPDNFLDPLRRYFEITGQVDAEGNLLTSNPETSGRYHSTWLSMMYPRLLYARELLMPEGIMLVSIDDHEIQHLRLLMDEVFGPESFLTTFVWHRRQMADSRNKDRASTDHEYVLAYRNPKALLRGKDIDVGKYANPDNDPRGDWFSADLTGLATKAQRPNLHYTVHHPKTGQPYPPSATRGWGISKENFDRLISDDRILWPSKPDGRPRLKKFLNEAKSLQTSFSSILEVGYTTEGTKQIQDLFGEKLIQFPKPLSLMKTLLAQTTAGDDIVLDFFAGSASTAHAVMELNREDGGNRRYIMVQLPEPTDRKDLATIAEIGKERLRRAVGALARDNEGTIHAEARPSPEDLGFRVFKLGESSFAPWQAPPTTDPNTYAQQMSLGVDPLRKGWRAEDVLWEVAIREGFALSSELQKLNVEGYNKLFRMTDLERNQSFVAALDDTVKLDLAKALELGRDDMFICRDAALTDEVAANLALQCRLKTI